MSVEVRRLRDDRREAWNRLVERSAQTNPFHRLEALELQAADTGTRLHPLVARDGDTPVGLFPVFELNRGPVTGAFSPPPKAGGLMLGPALLDGERGRRSACRPVGRFLDWIADRIDPDYEQFYVAEYDDVRPFQWSDYDVRSRFTYVVELTDEDDLLERFSRDARRNVRRTDASDYDIAEGGADAVRYVVGLVAERYREQGLPFPVDEEFAVALYRRLPEGRVRPYVCTADGERVGGLLVLEHGDTAYRWQGGVKPAAGTDVPVNDLLDWHAIREALDRGASRYDLVGAGDPDINRYKAKFDPELRPRYAIRGGEPLVRSLVEYYRRAHFVRSKLRSLVAAGTG